MQLLGGELELLFMMGVKVSEPRGKSIVLSLGHLRNKRVFFLNLIRYNMPSKHCLNL